MSRMTVKVGQYPDWDELTIDPKDEELFFPELPGRPRVSFSDGKLNIRYDGSITIEPSSSNGATIGVKQ